MLEDYLVTIACAAGSATFAAFVGDRRGAVALVLGFTPTAALVLVERSVAGTAVGALAALGAGVLLARSERHWLAAASAGVLAGLGAAYTAAEGAPSMLAIGAFALVPALAAWLASRRPAFAPARLRDEALLVVLAMGALAAVVPTLSDGWQTAVALQTGGADSGAHAPPPAWTLWLVAGALGAGMLVSVGRRR
jgi:hypothetical protein